MSGGEPIARYQPGDTTPTNWRLSVVITVIRPVASGFEQRDFVAACSDHDRPWIEASHLLQSEHLFVPFDGRLDVPDVHFNVVYLVYGIHIDGILLLRIHALV